jgi:hypothetical protein
MITVNCKTNLDLWNEKWPNSLPAVPNVGDYIQSTQIWDKGFQLRLEVYSVTWKNRNPHPKDTNQFDGWFAEIELHTPKNQKLSITDFYNWYAPKVGRSVSAFI